MEPEVRFTPATRARRRMGSLGIFWARDFFTLLVDGALAEPDFPLAIVAFEEFFSFQGVKNAFGMKLLKMMKLNEYVFRMKI